MAISPIESGLHKMKYWEPVIKNLKPNCNRSDLWDLIETKPDFFQNSEKYVKTGLEETEIYYPAFNTPCVDNIDWKNMQDIDKFEI